MLLAALARPPVSLDTTGLSPSGLSPAEVERLTGWLLVRLLEEGYTVVPDPEQAQIELSIGAQAEGYVVTADGAEHRSYVLGVGPAGVVSMEILHRAIEAVDQEGRQQAQPPNGAAVTTALEVRGEPDELLEKLLREQATLALSKSGRTLVPSSLPHDDVLCVVVDAGRILVGCGAGVEVARRGDRDDKIASGLREGIAAELAAPPEAHEAPVDEPPRPAKPRRRRESRAEPLPLELSLAMGWLMRGAGSDPLLQLRADVGSGLCFRGQTELSFSSEPEGLSVLEPSLQGGVAWCERGQHHAQLSVGLVAGVRLHHYDYEGDAGDAGNRLGWQAALPVDVALVVEPVILRLGAEVGVSYPTIEHEVLGVPAWRRSGTFVALLLGVGVRP